MRGDVIIPYFTESFVVLLCSWGQTRTWCCEVQSNPLLPLHTGSTAQHHPCPAQYTGIRCLSQYTAWGPLWVWKFGSWGVVPLFPHCQIFKSLGSPVSWIPQCHRPDLAHRPGVKYPWSNTMKYLYIQPLWGLI